MRWISGGASRGALLSLLCVIAATTSSGGAEPSPSVASPATPTPTELIVDVATPAALPRTDQPGATPAAPSPASLLAQELASGKAPVSAGPSTYVPILLYHYIRVNPVPRDRVGFNLSTPPAMFRAQMQYLADQGFHVISLHTAVAAIQRHTPLPSRPVVLTFDDGYADFFTAAVPAMQAHGFTATNFVISGRMGVPSFMTAAEVQAADQMGFTIGAHTVDHSALASLPPARAFWEMRQGKLALESLLGHPVLDFAYPYGSFNAYAMNQARALGFETAVSTLAGSVHTSGQLMFLSRIRIGGAMSLATYARLVGGPAPTPAELGRIGASPAPSPGLVS